MSPSFFRQLYRLVPNKKRRRWLLQPLLFMFLSLTWCLGASQPERFETARAFYVACHPKRRRPGTTFQGFQKALEALPCAVLRAVAHLLRQQFLARFPRLLTTEGWLLFGCDGSRRRTPKTQELERRLGNAGGDSHGGGKTPQVWLTTLVHLATGVPWGWQVGKGDASERAHLVRLSEVLPAAALVVTDAGYQAYQLACHLADTGQSFLLRASTQTVFYVPETQLETLAVTQEPTRQVTAAALEKWTDGTVYYWPEEAQHHQEPPLEVRLLRLPGRKQKQAVWLVTNVLDTQRLPLELASRYYRMRWENEGYFRTYKRTLNKVKLSGRTVAAVHREVLGSMLALQLLLVQGLAAAVVLGNTTAATSARQLLVLVRRAMTETVQGNPRAGFLLRVALCQREQRPRTSAKEKRVWSSRHAAKDIGPPRIRVLSEASNLLLQRLLSAAA